MERANPSNAARIILGFLGTLVGLLLSLPILALGLPFWTTGLCTRWMAGLLEPRFLPWSSIIGFDPLIGWRPKPNLKVYALAEEVFRITTGPDGWPGNTSLAEADLVVLGDSFAFGYGVSDRAMFARLIPQVRVKPIGSPGYNLVQELLILRECSSQLSGKLIVWFVFLGNDLWDNLYPYMHFYTTPFARRVNRRGDWRIEISHLSPKTRPYEYDAEHDRRIRDRLADVCSSSHLAERAYSACDFLIREAQEICKRHGARLCVFTIPDSAQLSPEGLERLRACSSDQDSFDPGLPDRKLFEICSKRGVTFLAGREHLTRADYRNVDRHWNERGHQRVAEILSNLAGNPSFLGIEIGSVVVLGIRTEGLHGEERVGGAHMRWTDGHANILVPIGYNEVAVKVAIELLAFENTPTHLLLDGVEMTVLEVGPGAVSRTIILNPPVTGRTLAIGVESATFFPGPQDPRTLGVQVRSVKVLP